MQRSRLSLAIAAIVLSPTLASPAFAQCTTSGGTISANTTAGCTVSTAGSTLSILNPATYTGWVNFSGANTTMVINSGASFVGSAAPAGISNFALILATGGGWTLQNSGSVQAGVLGGYDLIGIRGPGSYQVINTGSISNTASDAGANTVESTGAGATLQVVNSGTLNAVANPAVNQSGTGSLTLDNLASGVIVSGANRAIQAATLNLTNQGSITATTGGTLGVVAASGTANIRNGGAITADTAASSAIVTGTSADTLTLESTSNITGIVNLGGGTDTLVLAGPGNGTFDLGGVGLTQQYRAIENFEKREAGGWTLTGSSSAQAQNWRVFQGTLQLAAGATLEQGSAIETVDDSSGGLTTIRISGALAGTGVGITLSNPFNANALILDAGATFGNRTLLQTNGVTYLTGPTAFPNDVAITGGYFIVGDGGIGTGGYISGNVANDGLLIFNHGDAISYGGAISGSGQVVQQAAGTLTLTGDSTYSGGTSIVAGTLQIGNGGTTGSIVGNVSNSGTLAFNRSNALTHGGAISGGTLLQVGTGTTTLTSTGSSVDSVQVNAGTLDFAQAGAFNAGAFTTASSATTHIAADSTLAISGAFTQAANSSLNVDLGGTQPVISAATANLDGTLNITGFSASAPTSASALTGTQFNLIHTTGGISNDFAAVNLGASSPVDYLTLSGGKSADALDYNIGFGLTWLAGATQGNGVFTLTNAGDTFDVDVALANQAPSATGWDGTTLTKNGAGTLLLSAANTYTGPTLINAGTLRTGIANAFAPSSAVNVASGATLDLNNFNQTANQLTGAGNITLGSATLTANNTSDTTFGGVLSGSGGLVKSGAAGLTLTGNSNYTGGTTISAGSLQLGNGGTSGSIVGDVVDNGSLVFNRSDAVIFGGVISGSGSVSQAGTAVTLTGTNTYTGGTAISAGSTLQIGNGGTTGSIVGNVSNSGTLAFNRSNALTHGGAISGGTLLQAGTGTTTLTNTGSSVDSVQVNAGTLDFAQAGAFNAGAFTTASSATTHIAADSTLAISGAFTQAANSSLNVDLGGTQPVISAATANLDGTLNITGFSASAPTSASALTGTQFNLIHTTGGISNDFAAVNLGASSPVDYLTLSGGKSADALDYNIGFGLTWLAGATQGNGVFTLTNAGDTFDVDVALANQAPSGTGWDGTTLTKNGAGTLLLSAANTYTGPTLINAGTLRTGIANAFAPSSAVNVASGATLDLNNFNQTANQLTGAGNITLGSATLTANNTSDTTFGGVLSGSGGLVKSGAAGLTLTGNSNYTGGTTISAGSLQLGNGGTSGSIVGDVVDNGSLVFNRSDAVIFGGVISGSGSVSQAGTAVTLTGTNTYTGGTAISAGSTLQIGNGGTTGSIVGNVSNSGTLAFNRSNALTHDGAISGGTLVQAGTGTTTLTSTGSSVDSVQVNAGTLDFAQAGAFNAGAFTTASSATTHIAADSTLAISGAFTQAANSSLNVDLGGTQPVISAATANLDGTLNITGFSASAPTSASALAGTQFNLIHTTGGISNDFAAVNLGASSPVDYLTLSGGKSADALDYNIGFGLTWLAGTTQGNGVFTLTNAGDTFDVDVALANQAPSATGWDGTTLTKNGAGTLLLSAANTYTGPTLINAGTLRTGIANAFAPSSAVNVASGATLDLNNFNQTANQLTGAGNITLGSATLTANNTSDTTFGGVLSGSGGLVKSGAAGLTLTGNSNYTGGTAISAGSLQLGDGGTSGSIVGDVVINSGNFIFNRADTMSYAGAISGSGSLAQNGTGTVVLTGDSGAFGGDTTVINGRLQVDGSLGTAGTTVSVSAGGTIAGHGTIGGDVSIADGILAPGASPGTLTIAGDLALSGASLLNYEFGQAGTAGGALNDLTVVGGDLVLDGTLNVATSAGGTFGAGLYRVINYGGSLTDNGLVIGTAPGTDLFVQTSVSNQVNLINTDGLTLSYWDGAAGPRNNNAVNGGNGTWQNATGNDNWTTADGSVNASYSDASFAVFSAAPGTVTVDDSLGAVTASGLQFASGGYVLQGDAIALVETDAAAPGITTIRVGDGTGAGAGYIATINAALSGATSIDKRDFGTLVLGGTNTYTGGTTVSGGILSVGADANLGAAAGGVTLDGGTLATSASFSLPRAIAITANNGSIQTGAGTTLTASALISGTGGALTKVGDGTLLLIADNTYDGGTTISAGTLQLGTANGLTGSVAGNIVNNSTLALGHANAWTFAGAISGTGSVEQIGLGTTRLTADNTYTGGTTVSAGTLQIGNGGTAGSIVGNVANNAALVFNRSDALNYGGTITGSGSLTQAGSGTTTLTGAGSSVGSASVTAGALSLAHTGVFTVTGNYATAAGATTQIAADTTLAVGGAFSQAATATLDVALGSSQPVISATTANLGGTLNITGFGANAPTNASALPATHFNVIHATGGITGDFSTVHLGAATSPADYLTLSGEVSADTLDYNVGLRLTWLAGATLGDGTFTLTNAADTFDVDVALTNQTPSATGWDGTTLSKNGAGTLVLSAVNGYTGQTGLNAGTLRTDIADAFAASSAVNVAAGATLNLNNFNQTANNLSGAGNVALGSAVLTVNDSIDTTFAGVIGGGGQLLKTGAGALTLTGANTHAGGTTINAGTLQIGNGGITGSLVGDVVDNGTLAFNRSDTLSFAGAISGAGIVNQIGAGTTLLTGNSSAFSGLTQVTQGILRVDGTLGSASSTLTVSSGGTLGGRGTIGGDVSISDGILAPGASPGTLTINGDLTLTSASALNYEFGQGYVVGGALNDLTIVGGDLILDGTINVATSTGGSFGPGLYRVISYAGTLTDNVLELGILPPGSDVFVQTGFAGQVNLVNTAGLTLNYWDGAGPKFDGVINGGDGVWQASAGNDNWTEATGSLNAAYTDGAFAIFAGAPGTVTVDDSLGAIASSGMQFAVGGYVVEGAPITLLGGSNIIRVGDGTTAGAGYVATLGIELAGTGGIDKTDAGMLTLTGTNSYSGGTTISAGTLQLGDGGTTGSIVGNVVDNGILAFNRADALSFDGVISGTGAVRQSGAGTTTLTAANTYTGGTTISAGTLQLGDGVSSGSIVGDVVDNATLAFNNPVDSAFAGVISGSGNVIKSGATVLTFTGDNTYAGGTTIDAGTLRIGDGGTRGSIVGDVANNGTLVFDRSDVLNHAGAISGGAVVQAGTGKTTLTNTGSSVASTEVDAGTLELAQAGSFNTGSFTTATGATTSIAADSTLAVSGAFTQDAGSLLAIELGSTQPVIAAATASLGGTLDIAGFGADLPDTASALINTHFNVIHTTGGISNDFSLVELGGADGDLDFLTLAGGKSADSMDYNVGFGLTWLAGPTSGNGVFTLADASERFDIDIALGDQASSATGWDGTTLTKNGAGTLVLSAANTYTGATLINAGTLQAGIANTFAASSAVNVAGGATLDLNGFDQLAHNLGGAGSVSLGSATLTVESDGDTTFGGVISGAGSLSKEGAATLTLTGDNIYAGGTTINAGSLQIGDGGTGGSIVGNINNNAALVIDRAGTTDIPGAINGSGSLTKRGTGVATLKAANAYAGATHVEAGVLKAGVANAFSAASAHAVASGGMLDTGGFNQSVAALDNAGTVRLLSAIPGSTLTVTGAYVGQGGTLQLGTRLGDSSSPSDRLVLDGAGASASGSTRLEITNLGGLGALTSGNGIEVISARNGATTTAQTTKDAFELAGGAAIAGASIGGVTLQVPHIDAGAYEYRLYAADTSGAGENWYLRSTAPTGNPPIDIPTYRAEVPLFAGLPSQLRQSDLAMLGNLHLRIGDETSMSQDSQDASRDRRAWARVVYNDFDIRQRGTVSPQSEGHAGGVQVGTDVWADSAWRAGVYLGYLRGNADVAGNARGLFGRVGHSDTRSSTLGGYVTWMREDGLYADAVVQGSRHRYTLHPDFNPSVSGRADSLTGSIEAGMPFQLSDAWQFEPQLQVIYQGSDYDDAQISGARVQQDADGGWIGRLGVRLKGDVVTAAGQLQPYARANLYYGTSGTDVARFIAPAAITEIASRTGYTSTELAAGLTLTVNDHASLYGEVGHLSSHSGDARVRSSLLGSLGMRVTWK